MLNCLKKMKTVCGMVSSGLNALKHVVRDYKICMKLDIEETIPIYHAKERNSQITAMNKIALKKHGLKVACKDIN